MHVERLESGTTIGKFKPAWIFELVEGGPQDGGVRAFQTVVPQTVTGRVRPYHGSEIQNHNFSPKKKQKVAYKKCPHYAA